MVFIGRYMEHLLSKWHFVVQGMVAGIFHGRHAYAKCIAIEEWQNGMEYVFVASMLPSGTHVGSCGCQRGMVLGYLLSYGEKGMQDFFQHNF